MCGSDDDNSTGANGRANGATDDGGFSPDDPDVTPLGGNAGVHIQTDDGDDETDPAEQFKGPDEPLDEDLAVDFGGFVVSLGTSCMVNLGQHANPETGDLEQVDLPAARQTIDILEMLKRKTKGNLDEDERQLLDNLLRDLRQAYEDAQD